MPGNDYDRADQMNPNNGWESRGFDGRPDDSEDRLNISWALMILA